MSINSIRQPNELNLSGNVHANWKSFKQSFELYLLATGLERDNDRRKIALLLTVAGRSAIDVFNTFQFSEEEQDKYNIVMAKFEDYCTPKKNETYERYVFRNRMQKEGETIEQYVTDLRLKSQSCNFESLSDSMIRDQIVIVILDKKIRRQLLGEAELTLDKAIRICQASERANVQLKSFDAESEPAAAMDVVCERTKKTGKEKH